MGGNAIQNARRIDKVEYDKIVTELTILLPEINFQPVKAYRSKPDFGDIDLVVVKSSTVDLKELIRDKLNPIDEYDNGPFFSVNYDGVQVDFIFMSEDEAGTAADYFHWNDLGNFIGRVARSLNFKYGHDGLSYEYHFSDHYKISINVSRNTKPTLEFLGYDYDRWVKGFDTKEEIFEYALSTPYFNSLYFSLEEQAHNDRVRNRKRKMYKDLLTYIENKNIQPKPKLTLEERNLHLNRAYEVFGYDLKTKLDAEAINYERNVMFKELFNGNVITELTGLAGKELGAFIQKIRQNEDDIVNRVLIGGADFVKGLVEKYSTNKD